MVHLLHRLYGVDAPEQIAQEWSCTLEAGVHSTLFHNDDNKNSAAMAAIIMAHPDSNTTLLWKLEVFRQSHNDDQ